MRRSCSSNWFKRSSSPAIGVFRRIWAQILGKWPFNFLTYPHFPISYSFPDISLISRYRRIRLATQGGI
jgi:hypothetical protein